MISDDAKFSRKSLSWFSCSHVKKWLHLHEYLIDFHDIYSNLPSSRRTRSSPLHLQQSLASEVQSVFNEVWMIERWKHSNLFPHHQGAAAAAVSLEEAIKGNLGREVKEKKEREKPEDENERHFLIGNVTIAMNKWWKLIAIFFIIIFRNRSFSPVGVEYKIVKHHRQQTTTLFHCCQTANIIDCIIDVTVVIVARCFGEWEKFSVNFSSEKSHGTDNIISNVVKLDLHR